MIDTKTAESSTRDSCLKEIIARKKKKNLELRSREEDNEETKFRRRLLDNEIKVLQKIAKQEKRK